MYGFIYETTNLINGKKYIGKKQYIDGWETYFGSGILLKMAIKKYGIDNFRRLILCECKTEKELNEKEKFYIQLYNANNNEMYYNLAEGGTGGKTTQDGIKHPKSNKKEIIGYDIRNNIEYHFYCINTFCKKFNDFDQRQISDCLHGKQMSVKNFIFKYKNEFNLEQIPNRLKLKILKKDKEEYLFILPSELKKIIDSRRISEMYNGKRKEYQGYTVEFKDNSKPSLIYLE
jgi:hypothetical protein